MVLLPYREIECEFLFPRVDCGKRHDSKRSLERHLSKHNNETFRLPDGRRKNGRRKPAASTAAVTASTSVMADKSSKDKPVEMFTSPPLPPPHLPSNLEGSRAVLLAMQLRQVQHRISWIRHQLEQLEQAHVIKMTLQAAPTAPVLPTPTTKMAVHVACPAAVTVSSKDSKCETRSQTKNAAGANLKRRGGDTLTRSKAKV